MVREGQSPQRNIASEPAPARYRWFWCGVVACLTVQAALAVDSSRRWTPTHDEFWHLPLGLQMWRHGRTDLNPINPPLVRMWAALPLWLAGVDPGDVAPTAEPLAVGNAFLQAQGDRHREVFWYGRLMLIPVGMAAGALLAGLARMWFGDRAGLLAAVMWSSCPTWLSQSALVTHDLAAAAATVATVAALAWFRQQRSWTAATAWGLALGVAQLTKFTCVLLLPLCAALWFVLPRTVARTDPLPRTMRQVLWAGAVAITALHAGYGFQGAGQWHLLPAAYGRGWEMLQHDLQNPHPVFLNGAWRQGGFPQYYAWAFLQKLPLGTLGCLAGALWSCRRRGAGAAAWRHRAACLLAFLAFFGPASLSQNQLGLRYALPAYPWLILFAAQAAEAVDLRRRSLGSLVVLALAASLPWSLRHHPHHLAYFNELAGGPAHGGLHLVDSNLDWGQDLHALREDLRKRGVDEIGLAYFGTVSPSALGLRYRYPPPHSPAPGRYAVSVNFVAGRPYMLRDVDGRSYQADLDDFGYFRFFEPRARVGYSINVYELSPEDCARFHAARAAALGR